MKIKFKKQFDTMDCGVACLHMISQYYGKFHAMQKLRTLCHASKQGVSLMGLSEAAEAIGFRTVGAKLHYSQLRSEAPLPAIVHWKKSHYIIVTKVENNRVWAVDPGLGYVTYTKDEFLEHWSLNRHDQKGICLLLEPTPQFYNMAGEETDKSKLSMLVGYIRPYKKLLFQLSLGLVFGSILQLVFPFLTQAIVDKGINNRDIGFVYLVLIAQIVLFLSKTSVDFIRSWILLHISTRINVSLISDFLIKLLKLPIGFFDSKMIGDIIQRIQDHRRIESFLTSSTLNIIFSMLNLFIFACVLAIYSLKILSIFLIGSCLYLGWVLLFMNKRRTLDYKRFEKMSENQSHLYELITGVQEIKLNNVKSKNDGNGNTFKPNCSKSMSKV